MRSRAGRLQRPTKSAPSLRNSKPDGVKLLPRAITVLERGWLSSNNIVLRGSDGVALIDSGYGAHAAQTLSLVTHTLAGGALTRLVNTHCHSDHIGGNYAIQSAYRCRTTIPAGEAPLIDGWDERALVLSFADQRAERFSYDDTVAPGDVLTLGDIEWQALAAPGHDQHALMFYSPEERVLISGDALWADGFGVIFPALFGRLEAFAETRATLEAIAHLDVRGVIPGHGAVFTDVSRALERAFRRLESYEQDLARLARHCAKVMLVFALLEKRQMLIADLPRYCERVPILRELNATYFQTTPERLAEWLVTELERAGASERRNDHIVPLVRA
jgi:glyoxylase-like metal-dependent hydrolase (beta-lactamase superfamily II)